MKIKLVLIIILVVLLNIACHEFNNPVDPAATNYQGFYVYEEGEDVGQVLKIENLSIENGGIIDDPQPLIDWADIPNAPSYQIQISTNPDGFTNTEPEPVTVTNSFFQVDDDNNLSYGNTYYWRIRVVTASGNVSAWSKLNNFQIKSGYEIFGFSPIDDETIEDTTPVLLWNETEGITNYQVRYSTDETALNNADIFEESDTDFQITNPLQFDDTVYWQVRPLGEDGYPLEWSDIHSFIIDWNYVWDNQIPIENTITNDTTPSFSWSDIDGSCGYHIQVSNVEDFSSIINEEDSLTTSTYSLPISAVLSDNADYYWRVAVKNNDDVWDKWSAPIKFSIEIAPPTTPSPTDSGTTIDTTPTLDWEDVSGASGYSIQVSNDSTFTSIIEEDSTLSISDYTVSTQLTLDSTYYWRVKTENEDGVWGDWIAKPWSFNINIIPPTLVSPANGSTITDSTPYLDWDLVSGASSYGVQINTNNSFTGTVIADTTTTSSNYTQSTALTDNATYYWQVSTTNDDNVSSDPSSYRSFTVDIIPSVTTSSISNIGSTTATGGGTVAANGATGITARGVCWNTASIPIDSDPFTYLHTSDGSVTGSYPSSLTGLNPSTKYYVRAYVQDGSGTYNGDQVSFTTADPPVPNINEVRDTDVHDGDDGGVGNEDNEVNCSEEIDLEVEIKNNGDGVAYNIQGVLSLYSSGDAEYCTITDSSETITSLAAGASDEFDDFDFTCTGIPSDMELSFKLSVTYEDEYGNSYSKVFTGGDLDIPVYPAVFYPTDDALISYDNSNTNYGEDGRLYVQSSTYCSLLKFDLSQLNGRTIDNAFIRLKVCTNFYDSTPTAYRVSTSFDWDEDSVTWNDGVSYYTSDSASAVEITSGGYEWHSFSVRAIVQKWADGSTNNGFYLKATSSEFMSYYSKEFTGTASDPYLTVYCH